MGETLQMTEHRASQIQDHAISRDSRPMFRAVGGCGLKRDQQSHRTHQDRELRGHRGAEAYLRRDFYAPSIHEGIQTDGLALQDKYVNDVFENQREHEWQRVLRHSHRARAAGSLHVGADESHEPHHGRSSHARRPSGGHFFLFGIHVGSASYSKLGEKSGRRPLLRKDRADAGSDGNAALFPDRDRVDAGYRTAAPDMDSCARYGIQG